MSDKITAAAKADPVVAAVVEDAQLAPPTVTTQAGDLVATPKTTEEEDRVSAGQRDISMIWETTQRQIALAVIATTLAVAAWLAIAGATDNKVAASVFLYGVANLVIGFYFGRTNHRKVGGVV